VNRGVCDATLGRGGGHVSRCFSTVPSPGGGGGEGGGGPPPGGAGGSGESYVCTVNCGGPTVVRFHGARPTTRSRASFAVGRRRYRLHYPRVHDSTSGGMAARRTFPLSLDFPVPSPGATVGENTDSQGLAVCRTRGRRLVIVSPGPESRGGGGGDAVSGIDVSGIRRCGVRIFADSALDGELVLAAATGERGAPGGTPRLGITRVRRGTASRTPPRDAAVCRPHDARHRDPAVGSSAHHHRDATSGGELRTGCFRRRRPADETTAIACS
jgi:hypothetical protein